MSDKKYVRISSVTPAYASRVLAEARPGSGGLEEVVAYHLDLTVIDASGVPTGLNSRIKMNVEDTQRLMDALGCMMVEGLDGIGFDFSENLGADVTLGVQLRHFIQEEEEYAEKVARGFSKAVTKQPSRQSFRMWVKD